MIDFFFDEQTNEGLNKVADMLLEKGYTTARGRTRIAFIDPSHRVVIKIPLTFEGEFANGQEAKQWKRNLAGDDLVLVAACRLTTIMGYNLLIMQFITPIDPKNYPKWASYVDCGQVGTNRNGDVKAYDL